MSYDGSTHRCDPCKKNFVSKSGLNEHFKTKVHKKQIGDNSIVNNEQLITNNTGRYDDSQYCEPCDKTYSNKGKLNRHNGTEKHRKNYELFELKKITKIDLLNNLSFPNDIKNSEDVDIATLECKVCDKFYSNKSKLKRHCDTKLHKGNLSKSIILNNCTEKILIEQPISKYKCEVCDVSFGGNNDLKNHYMCSSHIEKAKNSDIICNLSYKPKRGAVLLVPKDINGNFILECEVCNNSHVNIFALTNHYETDLHKRNLEKINLLEIAKLKSENDVFLIYMTNKKRK